MAQEFYKYTDTVVPSLQSIGFIGPAIALIGLTTAKTPLVASAWLTVAVGLKAFSHSGFLVNLQVLLIMLKTLELLNRLISL